MKLLKRTIPALFAAVTALGGLSLSAGSIKYEQSTNRNRRLYADDCCEIISGEDYNIMVRLSGKMITADSYGNVMQWEKNGSDQQKWHITANGDGTCSILSCADRSLSLTVENEDSANGNNIFLSEYKGLPSQKYILHRTDDAYWITAECSGHTALDVYDISYDNGANIDQWDYWGGEGQKFYIKPADGDHKLLRCDINLNGRVDIFDKILVSRCIGKPADDPQTMRADLDGNGFCDENDVALISNFLLGREADIDLYAEVSAEKPPVAYLFAYFLGNAPEQERLSYAVSLDGKNFHALNGGRAVWQSDAGTKCIRDPYIFKGEDGLYHLLATDMKSSLGWNSNRDLISAKSTDLVHWFDDTIIKVANAFPNMQNCDRAWAPQAIYDPEKKSYMVYFAARVPGTDDRTIMYYAYSDDLKQFNDAPAVLFAPQNGDDAIDSDIIRQNGKYYMYYKNETNKRIYLAEADHANGPYREIKQVSEGNIGVEGPNIYKMLGSDKWLMMSDAYGNGYYVMQETSDLENFTSLPRSEYSFDFTPRHGYVIPINADQYNALVSAYPSDSLTKINTGIKPVNVCAREGEEPDLPEKVTALYSDGSTADMHVDWDLPNISTLSRGKHLMHGTVRTSSAEYADPFITERADPYIVDGGNGWFYFTASYPAYGSADKGYDRIILRRSSTVAGLADAEEKTIWKAHSSGIMSRHIWAPEMHFIGGKWYIFFAAGTTENVWAIRPYVLECDGDPYTGSWKECGQMQASDGDTESFAGFSLDMTYFEHNGRHYVVWAEIKGDSSLFMAEIDPSAPYRLISAPILLTKPEYNWETVNNRVNEGPSVLETNGKVYIFFSASGTGSEYCVGRLEADADADLMNASSWSKLSTPVLSTKDLSGETGPGHNCFVVDENGDLLVVYHARPASHSSGECGTYNKDPLYDPCRHTRIKQVTFAADGTPLIDQRPGTELLPQYKDVTATVYIY